MNFNGVDFWYDSSPGARCPVRRAAVNGAESQLALQYRSGGPVGEAEWTKAAKALLGWNIVKKETVGGVTRRWIERGLPAAHPFATDADVNPDNVAYLYASSVPLSEPISGIVTDHTADAGPSYKYGYRYHTVFSGRPYGMRTDEEMIAALGAGTSPLSPGTPAGAQGRPDEGQLYSNSPVVGNALAGDQKRPPSRFIYRRTAPAGRSITMPQGFAKWVDEDPALRTPVPTGLPLTQYRHIAYIHWCYVPLDGIPFNAIATCANKVNGLRFNVYPARTLLFIDASEETFEGPLGGYFSNMVYKFLYSPVGHEAWPRVKKGKAEWIPFSTTGVPSTVIGPTGLPIGADEENIVKDANDAIQGGFASLFRPDQG